MERQYIIFNSGKPLAVLSVSLILIVVAVLYAAVYQVPKLAVAVVLVFVLGATIYWCFKLDKRLDE